MKKASLPLILGSAGSLLAGCAMMRWKGSDKAPTEATSAQEHLAVSTTTPAIPRTHDENPEQEAAALTPPELRAQYYSDLGPDVVDVSNYPAQQKYNYTVYANVCARCHTLARSINAPTASRGFWELYILGMKGINRIEKQPRITKDETKAILDFLEYDSRLRKVQHRKEFKRSTDKLKRRYERSLRERISRLQGSKQPILMGGEQH